MDRFTCVRDDVGGAFVACAGRTAYADVCQLQNTIAQKGRHVNPSLRGLRANAWQDAAIHSSVIENN